VPLFLSAIIARRKISRNPGKIPRRHHQAHAVADNVRVMNRAECAVFEILAPIHFLLIITRPHINAL